MANAISFIIATPPNFGITRLGERGFCTTDEKKYRAMTTTLQAECLRVLKPGAYFALYVNTDDIRKTFHLFQKSRGAKRQKFLRRNAMVFRVPYIRIPGRWWYALPVSTYRTLIDRYSRKEELVVHLFSGSGNSALAAAAIKRPIVLVDRHYHARTLRRLRQRPEMRG